MSKAVLDASAVLALIMDEPGAGIVESAVAEGAVMSAVNVAEVLTKLVERDRGSGPRALRAFGDLGIAIIPFDDEHALYAATLRHQTKDFGLSLGDRACIALGMRLKLPVLTADGAWRKVQYDGLMDLVLIR